MSRATQRLLAIDSSTQVASVAAVEFDASTSTLRSEVGSELQRSHAPGQIGMIADAIEQAGWKKSEVDAIVVVRGPGSFTGVRIALGTARGLSIASQCPCVAVDTLEVMAASVGAQKAPRLALLGAGRGEYYVARYDADQADVEELMAPKLVAEADVWDWPEGCFVIGERVQPPESIAANRLAPVPPRLASSAALLVASRGLERSAEMAPFAPLYVRPSDAELARRARES